MTTEVIDHFPSRLSMCVRHVSLSLGSSILPFSLCLPSHHPVSAWFEHDISMTPF